MSPTRIRRGVQALAACMSVCFAITAAAQQAPAPVAAKTTTFDTVSIKPSGRPLTDGGAWGIGQNKYTAKNTPLIHVILEAYLGDMTASTDRLKGAPTWVTSEPYDIIAKADDATADSWKGLRQAQQVAIAAPLLRTMLEDRCKLVVHTVPTEIPGYELVLGKRPLKLMEAQADEPPPKGHYARFEGGWIMIFPDPGADAKPVNGFRKAPLAEVLEFMSLGGTPILDHTGLKGIYDFDLPRVDTTQPPTTDGSAAPPPPRLDAAHLYDWQAVGLEMKPIKVPAADIVIDHIERPTAN